MCLAVVPCVWKIISAFQLSRSFGLFGLSDFETRPKKTRGFERPKFFETYQKYPVKNNRNFKKFRKFRSVLSRPLSVLGWFWVCFWSVWKSGIHVTSVRTYQPKIFEFWTKIFKIPVSLDRVFELSSLFQTVVSDVFVSLFRTYFRTYFRVFETRHLSNLITETERDWNFWSKIFAKTGRISQNSTGLRTSERTALLSSI